MDFERPFTNNPIIHLFYSQGKSKTMPMQEKNSWPRQFFFFFFLGGGGGGGRVKEVYYEICASSELCSEGKDVLPEAIIMGYIGGVSFRVNWLRAKRPQFTRT